MNSSLHFGGQFWEPLGDTLGDLSLTNMEIDRLAKLGLSLDQDLFRKFGRLKGKGASEFLGGMTLARQFRHDQRLCCLIRGSVKIPAGMDLERLVGGFNLNQANKAITLLVPLFLSRYTVLLTGSLPTETPPKPDQAKAAVNKAGTASVTPANGSP